jgi:hypothetical protein
MVGSGQAKSEEIQSGQPPETLSEARALMVDLFLQFEEVGLADLDAEVATLTRESDALDDKYPDPAIQEPFEQAADCQELAAGAEN